MDSEVVVSRLGGQDGVTVALHSVAAPVVHTDHLQQQLRPPGQNLLVGVQAVDGEEEVGLQGEGEVGHVPAPAVPLGGAGLGDPLQGRVLPCRPAWREVEEVVDVEVGVLEHLRTHNLPGQVESEHPGRRHLEVVADLGLLELVVPGEHLVLHHGLLQLGLVVHLGAAVLHPVLQHGLTLHLQSTVNVISDSDSDSDSGDSDSDSGDSDMVTVLLTYKACQTS